MIRNSLCLALLFLGCFGPTAEDERALAELRAEYGDRYEFAVSQRNYLKVKAKGTLSDQDMIAIFKSAFLNEDETYRNTDFVWLNAYDQDGDFLYQLWFDDKTKEFGRNNQEYH